MNKWVIVVVLLGFLKSAIALCSYSSYGPKDYIIVSDENCKNATICAVNNTCTPYYFATSNSTSFYGMAAIGNMRDYPWSELDITDTPGVVLRDMILPPIVTTLSFENIPGLDLTSAKTTSWPNVNTLELLSCTNLVITNKINWPVNLTSMYAYVMISDHFIKQPDEQYSTRFAINPTISVRDFNYFFANKAIQHNGLTDLNYLPEKNITFLNLYNNSLQTVVNKDWRALNFLNLGENPLEAISNVQLSKALTFLYAILHRLAATNAFYSFCKYTKVNNITIDANTFAALNALKRWGEDDNNLTGFALDNSIETNAAQCTAIGGAIQPLFQGQTNLTVTACVLPVASPSSTTAPPCKMLFYQ
uniref:Secreted protein n=1 Tax=Thraustotheca clavata TaxID=74557 RepID=A0A0A7CL86_9STRA|nr:secreted protein [Thraustotheca clavata]